MATTGKQLFTTLAPDGKLTVEVAESQFPDPTGNQVLVKMEAAPINPSDLALLLGQADIENAECSPGKLVATMPEPFHAPPLRPARRYWRRVSAGEAPAYSKTRSLSDRSRLPPLIVREVSRLVPAVVPFGEIRTEPALITMGFVVRRAGKTSEPGPALVIVVPAAGVNVPVTESEADAWRRLYGRPAP